MYNSENSVQVYVVATATAAAAFIYMLYMLIVRVFAKRLGGERRLRRSSNFRAALFVAFTNAQLDYMHLRPLQTVYTYIY